MIKNTIQLSREFKSGAARSIASIILFFLVYSLLTLTAVALTALCIYAGMMLVIALPRFITIVIGIGLISMGIFILVFLLKFIFQKNKVDRSHLREITNREEPELFTYIEDIVRQVGTRFPKKVYLSSDVNAAVFYDSSFWSMFFSVRKNLQIGLGLVNTVTADELKAILAHEFGHFSQSTMKVGSYVYHVNHAIYHMLYNNESYHNLMKRWAGVSNYFYFFILIAGKIIQAIQWLLKVMYKVININYMSLSREMEFHADEIAAHVTGYLPLKRSLLRMDLAQQAYNSVLDYYSEQIKHHFKSDHIYREQKFVLDFLATENSIPFDHDLPQVSFEEYNKFNKSKLVIKDQWASHPTIEERIKRLEKLNIVRENHLPGSANAIFNHIELTQKQATEDLFAGVQYTEEVSVKSFDEFKTAFENNYYDHIFNKVYNGYYDHKNIEYFHPDDLPDTETTDYFEDLFSQEKLDMIYTSLALQNDIQILKQIDTKEFRIKTFDYDGRKYKQKDSHTLLKVLEEEQKSILEKIKDNDIRIYRYFIHQEKANHQNPLLKLLYVRFFSYDKDFDKKYEIYTQLIAATQFVSVVTPFEEIRNNFRKIAPMEEALKTALGEILKDELYAPEISEASRKELESYISSDLDYFEAQAYLNENLEKFFEAMHEYCRLLTRGYFLLKKNLLNYQAELIR